MSIYVCLDNMCTRCAKWNFCIYTYNEIFSAKGNHIRQVSIMMHVKGSMFTLVFVCKFHTWCALHVILPRKAQKYTWKALQSRCQSVFWHRKTKGNESFSHAVNFCTCTCVFKYIIYDTPFVYDVACLASGAFGG